MMPNKKHRLKAIDLYSGIGGWSLGFEIAGVDICASYEWWEPANKTHQSNLDVDTHQIDIRGLHLSDLPSEIDFVVGSPPCTQFSYSNRGGSGDIEDGLLDIKKFLSVVKHLNPTCWAMENVPRVANVLRKELRIGGQLEEYCELLDINMIHVYDFSDFGLPQKRKRCIAGKFDYKLLESYRTSCRRKTLGQVLSVLSKPKISDPNYRLERSNNVVTELEREEPLNWEELRYNREAKTHHPIYNNMEFPDPIDKPVRTVTATCTRVSRESIIIQDGEDFRRLSVRERGVLQGFPISYEFLGGSYAAKIKLIGNAIPPVFTYYLAQAMLGTPADKIVPLEKFTIDIQEPKIKAIFTEPDTEGKTFPVKRSFRFSIPNLRFKSGTRFELSNSKNGDDWSVKFFYGDSKRILRLKLDKCLSEQVSAALRHQNPKTFKLIQNILDKEVPETDSACLQSAWSGRDNSNHPFFILDRLGKCAEKLISLSQTYEDQFLQDTVRAKATVVDPKKKLPIGAGKLQKFAREIICGVLLGCKFNLKVNARAS